MVLLDLEQRTKDSNLC